MNNIRLVVFILFLWSKPLYAQWVTIPDPGFLTSLSFALSPAALSGNQMDTTHPDVVNLQYLYAINSGISNLQGVQYFDNLVNLSCYSNNLTSLPPLPASLVVLSCQNNSLTSLPQLPATLENLRFDFNQITTFPPLPAGLKILNCGNNPLSGLPVLPVNLENLNCEESGLTSLPVLPATLTTLNCSYNMLTTLPVFPNNLTSINISQTGSHSVLPPLPPNLEFLGCYSLSLVTLPPLPNTLETLVCNYNYTLSSLPPLPASLKTLSVEVNNLTSIPALPDSMIELDISYNPITCLPNLTTITTLNFNNTQVQCIPNMGEVANSTPLLSSLLLCDITNPDNCEFYYNINGNVFNDSSANCIYDMTENPVANVKVQLYQGGNLIQQTYTHNSGNYSFDTQLGTFEYSIDTTDKPYFIACPVSGYQTSIISTTDSLDMGMDFGLQCDPGFDIGASSIIRTWGQFFPGDTALINLKAGDMSAFYNMNCATGISGTVTVYFSGPITFGGTPAGSLVPVVNQNSLSYIIPDFNLIDFNSAFKFYMHSDTSALAGDQICFMIVVTPASGDSDTSNNTLTRCVLVVNSFDPNLKESSPLDSISNNEEWITYSIHFQNTGNAPAQNIVITDSLDNNLQESTFTFLSSSHDPYIQLSGSLATFTFANINLPDSVNNEPGSHGYIQYKVKADAGLAIGTTIENSAAIYFDFNQPIFTNTTVNTIVSPVGISEINDFDFTIFPNPAANYFSINLYGSEKAFLSIADISGRILKKHLISSGSENIDISRIDSGIYFIIIEVSNSKKATKIIIQ